MRPNDQTKSLKDSPQSLGKRRSTHLSEQADRKESFLAGLTGKALLEVVARSTSALCWSEMVYPRPMPKNGSAFFLNAETALFGVTAKHVFEAFKDDADRSTNIFCQLDNLKIDWRPRLISKGRDCDIATFEISPSELNGLQKIPVPWPPFIPPVHKTVLIGGFPGMGKRLTGSEVTFGLYFAATSVDSVNERDISMVREPDEEMTDIAGKGLPPRNLELGGISGGPAIAILDNASRILSWCIEGVIYECNASLEITKAARADLIGTMALSTDSSSRHFCRCRCRTKARTLVGFIQPYSLETAIVAKLNAIDTELQSRIVGKLQVGVLQRTGKLAPSIRSERAWFR